MFSRFPPGQVPEAADFLQRLDDEIEVAPRIERRAVGVAHDLRRHCLAELEGTLEDRGFHLDTTLMSKMMRALIYYVEETQLHNLDAPEKRPAADGTGGGDGAAVLLRPASFAGNWGGF